MSVSESKPFDVSLFHAALDARRVERGLRWFEVANEVGVSPSTLTRLGQGSRPDVDTFFKLCAWADLDPSGFDTKRSERTSTESDGSLPAIAAALRADKTLDADDVQLLEDVLTAAYQRIRNNG